MSEIRYLGLAKEETYGTKKAPTKFYGFLREGVRDSHEFIDVEAAAGRALSRRIAGPWSVEGDIEVFFQEDMKIFLEGLCGKDSHKETTETVDTTTAYVHTFTPQSWFDGYTLEIYPGLKLSDARYVTGAVFREATFEAPAREPLTARFSVRGHDTQLAEKTATPTISTATAFIFYRGEFSAAETLLGKTYRPRVEAFRLTHTNDLPDDLYVLFDRGYRGDAATGPLNVTGELDVSFADWSLFKKFLGSSEATSPLEEPTTYKLDLYFYGSTITGAYKRYLRIYMPRIQLDAAECSIDRRERIVYGLRFTALYDSVAGYSIRYTIRDTATGV